MGEHALSASLRTGGNEILQIPRLPVASVFCSYSGGVCLFFLLSFI